MNQNKINIKILSLILLIFTVFPKANAQINDQAIKISNNAFGGNFFIGYGSYTENIADNFTNPIYIGINLEYHQKKIVFQFADHIGFGKTKNTLAYIHREQWLKNKFVLSGMINLSFGYNLIDKNAVMIVPVFGIGFNKLSAGILELYDFKIKEKPILPHLKFGTYIDLKFIKLFNNNKSFTDEDGSYACPRLSFGYTLPMRDTNYSEYYNGNQFYVTLGFGGLGR